MKMSKKKLIAIIGLSAAVIIGAVVSMVIFIQPSNFKQYDVTSCTLDENSPIKGKKLYWLGSSVTLGMCSQNQAVPDFLDAMAGTTSVKEAVSGTTLFDKKQGGKDSYVTRLKNTDKFDEEEKIDGFVCQISTNDAKSSFSSMWGSVSSDYEYNPSNIDATTTAGAMEFVVTYVEQTWDCPIFFYSGSAFTDNGVRKSKDPTRENYEKIISLAKDVAAKWNKIEGYDVEVIDLFHDEEFNAISDEDYKVYMHDPVHPFKAGYKLWWTPEIQDYLYVYYGA